MFASEYVFVTLFPSDLSVTVAVAFSALLVTFTTASGAPSCAESFENFDAELPERANELYEIFVSELKKYVRNVGTGVFGAKMMYTINNDGPITIVMDSEVLLKKENKK